MVMVTLRQLVLSDAADPTVAVAIPYLAGSSKTWESGGVDELYAAGRIRASAGARPGRQWPVATGMVPLAVAQYVHVNAGRIFWARDPLGGKVSCRWDSAPYTELGPVLLDRGQAASLGTLTLREVTAAEVPGAGVA